MTKITETVLEWAKQKGLLTNSDAATQLIKLQEEMGETSGAFLEGDRSALAKEIGDMGVVLTIFAALNNLSFEQCILAAHKKNTSRKSKMIGKVLVKEK